MTAVKKVFDVFCVVMVTVDVVEGSVAEGGVHVKLAGQGNGF